MSQIYKQVTAGNLPPSVPTSFVTDDGTAIPAANILNVLGQDTADNNNNGITTEAIADGSNNLYILLTNRSQNSVTTTDATVTDVIGFNMTADGTYTFDIQIAGYSTTLSQGVGYAIFGTVKSVAGVGSVIGTPDKIVNEDAALTACNAGLTVVGNSARVQVTGIAGTTINWNVVATYVYASS